MNTFNGFSASDKKAFKIFGGVFVFFISLSLLGAINTPSKEELNFISGHLTGYDCAIISKKTFTEQMTFQIRDNNDNEATLSFTKDCLERKGSFTLGSRVTARYNLPLFGDNKIVYELFVEEDEVLSYDESSLQQYKMPFGIIVVFGVPWAIWVLIKLARS